MLGAAFVGYPAEEPLAVPVAAVLMEADIGAVEWVIATGRVAVRMLGRVGADNAKPSLGVCSLDNFTTSINPSEDVIASVVIKPDPL